MYYPSKFEYHSPTTINEVLELLERFREDARILAGGQSFVPLLKLRIASPSHVIDVNKIGGLSYIERDGERIRIGALTRHREIMESELVKKNIPALAEAASRIGDPAIRNMGTIGGNLCHCDPSSDYLPVCLVLGAEVKAVSKRGERTLGIESFIAGTFMNNLSPDEMLVEVSLPLVGKGAGCSFHKHEVAPGDFAVVNAASLIRLDQSNVIDDARVSVGGITPKAVRIKEAEGVLRGKKPSRELIEKAAQVASENISPQSDWRASSEYRRFLAKRLVKESLEASLKRAGEQR